MAYEIIDGNDKAGNRIFTVKDPHPMFPVVYAIYGSRGDAEEALAEIKRDEDIHDSFDAWIHAKADEHGVHRSEIAKQLDVHQFMR
jgi:hypothetical protein